MPFDPEHTYVHLAENGQGRTVPGGAAFWLMPSEELLPFDEGWLVSEYVTTEDLPNWEIHPEGEEFVYLLSGDIEFLQETDAGLVATRITGRGAVLVPRGVWHTARVFSESRMLFVTRGSGTEHRPVTEE